MVATGQGDQEDTLPLTSIEICAGAGGQAVGLHKAGFQHLALVEWEPPAVATLRANASKWPGWDDEKINALVPTDVKKFLASEDEIENFPLPRGELDLLAGGVPCPPFSLAGKRLGEEDERDLFPEMLRIAEELLPKAIMIENVRGILEPPHVFIDYRRRIVNKLHDLGYSAPLVNAAWTVEEQHAVMRRVWRRMEARDFGVPQLRPRAILVVIRNDILNGETFRWPKRTKNDVVSVRAQLEASMEKRCRKFWNTRINGRTGKDVFRDWLDAATKAESNATAGVAPTLVGGSKKHGGADLGPSRAKRAWGMMGVDATGIANDMSECDPERDLFRAAGPMLTVQQAAMLQGFPEDWKFEGRKTARYRQVGNAFPPPVAEAVGRAIAAILLPDRRKELLEDYVMEDAQEAIDELAPRPGTDQMTLPLSEIPAAATAGDDLCSDLVSAQFG